MLESQLAALIISTVNAGLSARGYSSVQVKRDNQPRQQGVPTNPVIFLHHIHTQNIGWVSREDVYDKATLAMNHYEIQRLESQYQFDALAQQSPLTPTALMPEDYLALVRKTLQSSQAITLLKSSGVGIQHITDMRVMYFEDDKGQNETNPSFDIVFSHQDVDIVPGTIISKFNSQFKGI